MATVVLLAAAWTGAQDGALVASRPVKLDPQVLASLGPYRRDAARLIREVEVFAITYLSDGLRVKGYLALPRRGRHLPCVIYNRGGAQSFAALSDPTAVLGLGLIASWGYVVVGSQYRGNEGGDGQEEYGGADVDDVLSLLPLLESQPRADASRVGMVGLSRGGMMTYLALTKTDRTAAAVVIGGLTDLVDFARRRPDMETVYTALIPGYPEEGQGGLEARSAVRWAEKLCTTTPLLIMHGTADSQIDPSQALAMAARLLAVGHPFRLVLFEGGDHALSQHTEEYKRLTRAWLDHFVRDRKPLPGATAGSGG